MCGSRSRFLLERVFRTVVLHSMSNTGSTEGIVFVNVIINTLDVVTWCLGLLYYVGMEWILVGSDGTRGSVRAGVVRVAGRVMVGIVVVVAGGVVMAGVVMICVLIVVVGIRGMGGS